MPNANDGVIAAYGNSSATLPSGYLGQSYAPELASPTAVVLTTAYGYLTRVHVPVPGVSSIIDVVFTSGAAVTNAVWALYTGTGVAPGAWTAEAHATVTGTAGLYSIPWVTPVQLAAGDYYVYQEVTGTAPSMPAVTATTTGTIGSTIMNPNCTLASGTLNAASLSSGAVTAVTATTTLAFGTSWALSASKLWYGIR